MNEQKYKKVVSGLQHTGYINQYERWDALLLLEEYKNKLDKTLKLIEYYQTTEWGLRGYDILEKIKNELVGDKK